MSDQQDLEPQEEQQAPPVAHPDFERPQQAPAEAPLEAAPEGPRYSYYNGRFTGDDPEQIMSQMERSLEEARRLISRGGVGTPDEYEALGIEQPAFEEEPEPILPLLPDSGQIESVQDLEMLALQDPRGAYELASQIQHRIPNAEQVLERLEGHWMATDPGSYMRALKQELVNQIQQSNQGDNDFRFDTQVEKAVLYARQMDPAFVESEPQIIEAIQANPWLMDGLPMDGNGVYADTPALAERLVQVQRWVWANDQAQAEAQPEPQKAPPKTITRSTSDRGDDEVSEHIQRVKDSVTDKNTWAFN